MSKHIIQIDVPQGIRTASVSPYRKDGQLRLWTKIHTAGFKFKTEPEYLLRIHAAAMPSAQVISQTLLASPKWNSFFSKETEIPTNIKIDKPIVLIDESIDAIDETIEAIADLDLADCKVEQTSDRPAEIRAELAKLSWLQLRAKAKSLEIQASHLTRPELTELIVAKLIQLESASQPAQPAQPAQPDVANMFRQLDASQLEAMASLLNMMVSGKK